MYNRAAIIALISSSLVCVPVLPALAGAPAEDASEDGAAEPEPELSEEERTEQAKALYVKAEKLAKKKKWKEAVPLYEEAYYLVPGKHGFAHKVGIAAHKAGDCDKALEYMLHFMRYADAEEYADKREEARQVLADLLEQGCVTEEQLGGLHLTEKQRENRSRELYQEAEALAAKEQWAEAAATYEQAYYLAPNKHGFAHKIGMAAHKVGDCDMAHEYLVHFVDYADPTKYADKMAEATRIVNELEQSGCVSQTELDAHQLENPFEINPDDRRTDDKRKRERSGGKGLLIGGSALAGVGVAGLGVGIAGFVLAGSSQGRLDELASTDTPSGYSDGDYACRDVPSSACPPKLEQQIASRQIMGGLGVGLGAAALVGGGALIALHFVRGGDGEAESGEQARVRLDAVGPLLMHAGGGASARLRF